MFSGIVEKCQEILKSEEHSDVVRITIPRPSTFDDIRRGDSIAINGVCLTLESFDQQQMEFALGKETLTLLNWKQRLGVGSLVNLERSLKQSDRVHGHIVSGHVDCLGEIVAIEESPNGRGLKIQLPINLKKYVMPKGSICLNGVSLTVNTIDHSGIAAVWLIPETLQITNLKQLQVREFVHVEVDSTVKTIVTTVERYLEGVQK